MNMSRITIGIHRPIDIVGGSIVGLVSAFIITNPILNAILQKKLYDPLVNFQEWLFIKLNFWK